MNNQIRVLVIDDDEINIFITKKIVTKTGYDVQLDSKINGLLALDYLMGLRDDNLPLPHLLLIDINMPVLNGWQFLDAYKELNIDKEVEIYMVSSSIYENDIERARSYSFVKGFIFKPLSIVRMTEIFEEISKTMIL